MLVTNLGMVFYGAAQTGIGWDETYHVQRLTNYLDHGWFLIDDEMNGKVPAESAVNKFVYAPVAMLLLHGWSVLVDGSVSAGVVSASPDAFAARHQAIGLIALLGLAATVTLGRLLVGSWRWGLVAAALLSSLPLWSGHAMFNIKDIPVATGYTLVTLGLALIARQEAGGVPRRMVGPITLAAGTCLAVGTRPGIWVGVLAGIIVLISTTTIGDLAARGSAARPTARRVGELPSVWAWPG